MCPLMSRKRPSFGLSETALSVSALASRAWALSHIDLMEAGFVVRIERDRPSHNDGNEAPAALFRLFIKCRAERRI